MLVEEGARVLLGREVAALEAPVGPGAGEAIEHLAGVGLAAEALFLGELGERALVGDRPPRPGGDLRLLDLLQAAGDAGLAEILLREDVGGDLAPVLGHEEAVEAEDDRAVGVLDLARGAAEFDRVVRRLAGCREAPRDLHKCPPCRRVRLRAPTRHEGRVLMFVGSRRNGYFGRQAHALPSAKTLSRLACCRTHCLDWADWTRYATRDRRRPGQITPREEHCATLRIALTQTVQFEASTPKSLYVADRTHTRCR